MPHFIAETNKNFCYCGLYLIDSFGIKRCPKHGLQWDKAKYGRSKIGKWSGPSKRYKGAYERY